MIDKKTVHEIAHLARLELKEGEDENLLVKDIYSNHYHL